MSDVYVSKDSLWGLMKLGNFFPRAALNRTTILAPNGQTFEDECWLLQEQSTECCKMTPSISRPKKCRVVVGHFATRIP